MIPVPKDLLLMITSNLNEAQIHDLVKGALKVFKEAVLSMKGGYDLKRCISTLEEYMRVTGMSSDHTVRAGVHCFTVRHDMGISWSLFVKSMLEQLFTEFVPDQKVEFEISEGTAVVRIALGSDWDEHDY